MRFDFTEQQREFQTLARDVLTQEVTPSYLRSQQANDRIDTQLWKRLATSGLLGLTIPAEYGGAGLSLIDCALVIQETGRVVAPDAVANMVAVAAPTLDEFGSDQQRERWLPFLVNGDAVIVSKTDTSPFVVDLGSADALVLAEGSQLHLVPIERVRASREPSIDEGRRPYRIDGVELDATTLLPGSCRAAVHRFCDRATVATALQLNGVSTRLVELTVEYVEQRHQFGRAIGSFQAVKHRLAEAATAATMACPAAWYGAYAVTHALSDSSIAASVAKSSASDAQREVNYVALQLHGGIGYAAEYDLGLWLKRGQALERVSGSARWHRDRIAHWIFDDETRAALVVK